jgi:hypothetical protein
MPSDAPSASPEAYARVAGANGGSTCFGADAGSPLTIGAFAPGASLPDPVIDGQPGVYVTCAISARSDGYDVNVRVNTSVAAATASGLLWITGHVTSAGGQNLSATFGTVGQYSSQRSCTVTAPTPPNGAAFVAPGRIWGHISCPATGVALAQAYCDVEADFLFQNCAQ